MIKIICLVIAFICFVIKAAGIRTGQVDCLGLGAAFVVLSLLVG